MLTPIRRIVTNLSYMLFTNFHKFCNFGDIRENSKYNPTTSVSYRNFQKQCCCLRENKIIKNPLAEVSWTKERTYTVYILVRRSDKDDYATPVASTTTHSRIFCVLAQIW